MNGETTTDGLIRTLRDAGCGAALAAKFMDMRREGNARGQQRLLKAHRSALLRKIHANQKRLDCLDFLLFHLRREKE